MPSNHNIIELERVSKAYHRTDSTVPLEVYRNFSFSIPNAEHSNFVVFCGPSGCGKTTLLRLLSGAEQPDAGRIRVLGRESIRPGTLCATVPQHYTCFPWLTAIQNVQFGLRMKGHNKETIAQLSQRYLEKVGLCDHAHVYPTELSGGMQQRVALARTLAIRPQIVLMDEPFGSLDAHTRFRMQQMLLDIWDQERHTILFVTHDIHEAIFLADKVIVLPTNPITNVMEVIDIPFTRPRHPELLYDTEFLELHEHIICTITRALLPRADRHTVCQ